MRRIPDEREIAGIAEDLPLFSARVAQPAPDPAQGPIGEKTLIFEDPNAQPDADTGQPRHRHRPGTLRSQPEPSRK